MKNILTALTLVCLGAGITLQVVDLKRDRLDRYGNCYHEPVNEMGESNICHQYCSPHGLHGYDTKKGQLLVCVCDDPKENENDN